MRSWDRTTKQPLTGAKVFIIIPHQHARNAQEWNEHVAKYGGYDDPTRNQELREQNIAETGNATTEEGPPDAVEEMTELNTAPHGKVPNFTL